MSHSEDGGWNDISSFLRQVDTSINDANVDQDTRPDTPRAKYHVDTVKDEVATLDDAIRVIDEIRLYTRRGILISRGHEYG